MPIEKDPDVLARLLQESGLVDYLPVDVEIVDEQTDCVVFRIDHMDRGDTYYCLQDEGEIEEI